MELNRPQYTKLIWLIFPLHFYHPVHLLSQSEDKQVHARLFHKGHRVRVMIKITFTPKDTSRDKLLKLSELTNGKNLTTK